MKYYFEVQATITKTIVVEADNECEAWEKIDDEKYDTDMLEDSTIMDERDAMLCDVENDETED